MRDFIVACPDCLINIALQIDFNLGCQLVDLLEGLIVNGLGVQDVSNEALISTKMGWISIVIIFILKESIVSLAVASCHLNSSHSCSISHIANHT